MPKKIRGTPRFIPQRPLCHWTKDNDIYIINCCIWITVVCQFLFSFWLLDISLSKLSWIGVTFTTRLKTGYPRWLKTYNYYTVQTDTNAINALLCLFCISLMHPYFCKFNLDRKWKNSFTIICSAEKSSSNVLLSPSGSKNYATMSIITLVSLDDGETIDLPEEKTIKIGRGSFLKVIQVWKWFYICSLS